MSDTIALDDEAAAPSRRSRSERMSRREEPEEDAGPAIEGMVDLSPDAVLADTANQLKAQTRAAEEQGRLAREADRRAQQAEQQLAAVQGARVTDAQMVMASALETAKATEQSAIAKLRAARDTGDLDAEIAAQRDYRRPRIR